MKARWLVDARDVILLMLLALTSLALCSVSIADRLESRREIHDARRIVARADSLVRDWTGRGCAPRTTSVP